jgi:hypothetical protein
MANLKASQEGDENISICKFYKNPRFQRVSMSLSNHPICPVADLFVVSLS